MDSYQEIFTSLINSAEARILGTFDRQNLPELENKIKYAKDKIQLFKTVTKIRYEFPFSELKIFDHLIRNQFTLAMAQGWLLSRVGISMYHANLSALAILLGSGYSLDLDLTQMVHEMYRNPDMGHVEKHAYLSIAYKDHGSIWPELSYVKDVSVIARKTLILVTSRMTWPEYEFVSFQDIANFNELKPYATELIKRGILNANPSASDLLGCIPNKALKKFAARLDLKSKSSKANLLKSIKDNVSPDQIQELVDKEVTITWPIRPNIENLYLFKRYIRAEMYRLQLYLEWIGTVHFVQQSIHPIVPSTIEKESTSVPKRYSPEDNFRSVNLTGERILQRLRTHEKEILSKYWDNTCDDIVQQEISENRWAFPLENIKKKILKYWKKTGKLELYKQERIFNWNTLLDIYIEGNVLLDKSYHLEPIEHICSGCGSKFIKSSIYIRTAVRVKLNIRFCYSCYVDILYDEDYKRSEVPKNQKDMLKNLFRLVQAIDLIPTKQTMKDFPLPAFPTERQIQVGQILLEMPTTTTYLKEFGSWLNCLILSGVVENAIETPRGVQCVAIDGHLCLSLGEKTIDDWMHNRSIMHEKEVNYPFHPTLNSRSLLRTDWQVGEIFVEYAGMMQVVEYYAKMNRKKRLAKELGLRLIIIEPKDLGSLDDKLGFLASGIS